MNLIMHLGAHKTGTSSVQGFLKKGTEELSQHGWSFVQVNGSVNLGCCVSYVEDEENGVCFEFNSKYYSELINCLKKNKTNKIISSEDMFFLNNEDDIKRFCRAIQEIFSDIVVVVYLRNQVDMALSNKAQGAKTHRSAMVFGCDYTNPLPEMSSDVYSYLDYFSKLKVWNSYLPKAHFIVRNYNRDELINNDSVHDFVSVTGLPIEPKVTENNRSLGSTSTNVLHALKWYGVKPSKIWKIHRSRRVVDLGGAKQQPSRYEAEAFYRAFDDSNKNLRKEYGIDFALDISKYPEKRIDQEIYFEDMLNVFVPVVDELIDEKELDRVVKLLRSSSLLLEDVDTHKSYELMKLAGILRPNGAFIKQKSTELKKKLANTKKLN